MNYSLLVMEIAGMMKMVTVEGSPPLAGCRNRVPIGFWWLKRLAAAESPDLGYVLEVWVFIGIFGAGLTSRRCPS